MKLKTKKKICSFLIAISVVTILGTISYAYFTGIAEVSNPQKSAVNSGTIKVTFADNDDGIKARLDFDESVTKKFTIKNTGTLDATIKLNWVDLINTYIKGSLTYTLEYSETENGTYKELIKDVNVPNFTTARKTTLARNIFLPVGTTYYFNLVITLNNLEDMNQLEDLKATFSTRFEAKDAKDSNSLIDTIVASSNGVRTDFSTIATTDEGIFEMEDNYGTSYYFRGAVENNYVKFGKNKEGNWMWWRIVRINGDGSLRIQYDGAQSTSDETKYTKSPIYKKVGFTDINQKDAKYVGWMYGPAGSSSSTSKEQAQENIEDINVKQLVDTWYKENLYDTIFASAISDTLFCNDRSIETDIKNVANGQYSSYTTLGYGENPTIYKPMIRNSRPTVAPPAPQYICPQKNDSFTVSDTHKGNGDLTYPIGLITADELVAAGGLYGTANNKYYLYNGSGYLTMSPSVVLLTKYPYASIFNVYADGSLGAQSGASYINWDVFPVINLTQEYTESLIGTGTISDPYRLS